MKHYRTLSTVLLLSLLLSACASDTPASDTTADTSAADTTAASTDVNPDDLLPDADFGGATVSILTAAEQWSKKYDSEQTGDQLDDAVYERNRWIEEEYNVTLEFAIFNGYDGGNTAVTSALTSSVMAGDATYDLYMGGTGSKGLGARITAGLFMDLAGHDELQLEKPWYYQHINTNIMVGDRLYLCAGALGLKTLSENGSVLFNKELIEELKLNEPYPLVREGKWTLDKMMEIGRSAIADLNGDTVMDKNDRYGILDANYTALWKLPYAMGRLVTEPDADGIPRIVGTTDRVIAIMDKLAQLKSSTDLFFKTVTDVTVELIPMFCADQGLFVIYPLKLVEYAEMREAPDFGILPYPKLDENQENYLTMCFADIAGVPIVVKDASMSCTILDAMNCYSYYETIPVYYDIVLSRKLTRDEDSVEMLDILMEGAVLDFGAVFYDEIDEELVIVKERVGTYASWFASIETSAKSTLERIVDNIMALE